MTCRPACARSAASRWCDHSEATPAPANAAYTCGSTQSGHSTVRAGRAGTSWTCTSRSARRPAAGARGPPPGRSPRRRWRAATRSSARRYAVRCASGLGWCREPVRRRPELHQGASVVDLSISSADRGDVTVVHVAGEIDVYTAPVLRERARQADRRLAAATSWWTCRGVTFMDSTGLGRAGRPAQAGPCAGRHAASSCCTSERILKVFAITGLDKVFQIFDSTDEALAPPPERLLSARLRRGPASQRVPILAPRRLRTACDAGRIPVAGARHCPTGQRSPRSTLECRPHRP